MAKGHKRRQYFIDRNFQAKFIIKFCAVVILFSLLAGGVLFLLSQNSTTVAIENTRVQVKRTSDFMLPLLIQTLLIAVIFSALATIYITLRTSHKISGPLYRLKREIDSLKDADLTCNFNIRTKDQLQALAKSLSEMSESLRQKHIELKKSCATLKDFLEKQNFSIPPEQREEFSGLLEKTEGILNSFKV